MASLADNWPTVPRSQKKTCAVCGDWYFNEGAHAERCIGPTAECRVCGGRYVSGGLNKHGDCRACVEASLDRAFGWNFWTWRRS